MKKLFSRQELEGFARLHRYFGNRWYVFGSTALHFFEVKRVPADIDIFVCARERDVHRHSWPNSFDIYTEELSSPNATFHFSAPEVLSRVREVAVQGITLPVLSALDHIHLSSNLGMRRHERSQRDLSDISVISQWIMYADHPYQ